MSGVATRMLGEADADAGLLAGRTVSVIGYGSQGRGQALNLRDSGVDVRLGLREGGASWALAEEDGWSPAPIEAAAAFADVLCMLLPDMEQARCYRERIEPNLPRGSSLLFSHGLAIHYGLIEARADVDVLMVAPKGPGRLVREQYEAGFGVPCLIAAARDGSGRAMGTALAYAHAIGGTRAGVIETTFAEETETDLFGEQAVLCGGVSELISAGFETLVEAGYTPEVAYFECLHELKLIVDLIYRGGFERMHRFVSDTAQYGDHTRGPRVIDASTRARMREILAEIRSGAFAREWVAEWEGGAGGYRALQRKDAEQLVERVGRRVRASMAWLDRDDSAAGRGRPREAAGARP